VRDWFNPARNERGWGVQDFDPNWFPMRSANGLSGRITTRLEKYQTRHTRASGLVSFGTLRREDACDADGLANGITRSASGMFCAPDAAPSSGRERRPTEKNNAAGFYSGSAF